MYNNLFWIGFSAVLALVCFLVALNVTNPGIFFALAWVHVLVVAFRLILFQK